MTGPLPSIMPFWGGGEAVNFEPSQRLTRSSLTGVVDGNSFTFSCHIRSEGADDAMLGQATGSGFGQSIIKVSSDDIFGFFSRVSNGIGDYDFLATGGLFTAAQFRHLLISASGTTLHLYVDGVDRKGVTNLHSASLDYTWPQNVVGAQNDTGSSGFEGCLQEYWFDFNTFFDFSIASERAKFDLGTLGSTGQNPTGSTPDMYFEGDQAAFPTNKGTAGAFTLVGGPLTACSIDL